MPRLVYFLEESVSRILTKVNGQLLCRWSAVILWMGMIFALSAIPSIGTPLEPTYDFGVKKLAHVAVYGILTALLFRAVRMHVRHKGYALLAAGLVAVFYGFSDEWHQTFVPGREGSLRDVAIDAAGAVGMSLWLGIRVPFTAETLSSLN